jgi:hypothetical protein
MAYRPCVSCGQRFHGGSVFTYLTWYLGEEKYRVRMQQCMSCSAELRNSVLAAGDTWSDGDWAMPEGAPVSLHQRAS